MSNAVSRTIALATMAAWAAAAAHAAETRQLALELNDLQPADGGCRAVFVLHNGIEKPIQKLSLRVVAFDTEQHATLFLSLDVGELIADKTRVFRFDLGSDVKCSEVSRLVLDDVTVCDGPDLTPARCLAAISLSSRAGVPMDF